MIEPITQEEFESAKPAYGSREKGDFALALEELQPLTGFKVPCRWKHYNVSATRHGQCSASTTVHSVARKHMPGAKFSTTCNNGTLYVFRLV
jgi:hypothetical protein